MSAPTMRADVTPERLRELFDYAPDTGILTWKVRPSMRVDAGDAAGYITSRGYVSVRIKGREYKAHRIAWAHCNGVWPTHEIDHLNCKKDDNRIANLRDVTRAVNQQNERGPRRNNRLGVLGIRFAGRRYGAQIWIDGRIFRSKLFRTIGEAYNAYVELKRKHHEGCTL